MEIEDPYRDPWYTFMAEWQNFRYMHNDKNKKFPSREALKKHIYHKFMALTDNPLWYIWLKCTIIRLNEDVKAYTNSGMLYMVVDKGNIMREFAAKHLVQTEETLPILDGKGNTCWARWGFDGEVHGKEDINDKRWLCSELYESENEVPCDCEMAPYLEN